MYIFSNKAWFGRLASQCTVRCGQLRPRVARWYIFKTKIPILVDFWRPWIGIFRYIIWPFGTLRPFGVFNALLVYFWSVFPFWFNVPRKIWQPCSGHDYVCCNFFLSILNKSSWIGGGRWSMPGSWRGRRFLFEKKLLQHFQLCM
jgi:hypothetical protein